MKANVALFLILTSALAAGCRGSPPYRTSLAGTSQECEGAYELASWPARLGDLEVDAPRDQPEIKRIQDQIGANRKNQDLAGCWNTFHEQHANFDLYSIEFDDQGWLAEPPGEANGTRLTTLINDLEAVVHAHRPLSIIIYTHGWHHSAAPDDTNVIAFRQLLEDASKVEDLPYVQAQGNPCCFDKKRSGAPSEKRRIVGIYVGWRGDSAIGPVINEFSIWDRKHTAETVALGSVQEFFARMHGFFLAHACHLIPDSSRRKKCCERAADVRMLTIGHSFGGLITYRALAPRLMLGITETTYTLGEENQQGFAYSYGDLTVLINPAFEATRFEPLAEAAACRRYVRSDKSTACRPEPQAEAPNKAWTPQKDWQLPTLIVATSSTDSATGWWFPRFRWATTWFERVRGDERAANVEAVGWDQRYQTHSLVYDPKTCSDTRGSAAQDRLEGELRWAGGQHGNKYVEFDAPKLNLSDCLQLTKGTQGAWQLKRPPFMPLWVIKTDASVIDGHNDFLNPHFVDFVRQIYFAILLDTQPETDKKQTASGLAAYHDSGQ